MLSRTALFTYICRFCYPLNETVYVLVAGAAGFLMAYNSKRDDRSVSALLRHNASTFYMTGESETGIANSSDKPQPVAVRVRGCLANTSSLIQPSCMKDFAIVDSDRCEHGVFPTPHFLVASYMTRATFPPAGKIFVRILLD